MLALALTLAMGLAANTHAAPRTFYGVVPQTPLVGGDFKRMGEGGVGTLRSMLSWASVDPTKAPDDYNWSVFDTIVGEAARNGVTVLPFVYGSPEWVAKGLERRSCTGARCATFAPRASAALDAWGGFVGDAVDRYGRGGEFWAENRGRRRSRSAPGRSGTSRTRRASLRRSRRPRATRSCSRRPRRRSAPPTAAPMWCSAGWPSSRGRRRRCPAPSTSTSSIAAPASSATSTASRCTPTGRR